MAETTQGATMHGEILELRRQRDLLINALEAMMRWPYDRSIPSHAAQPDTIGPDFDDRYKCDMWDVHAGLNVIALARGRR